MEDPIKAVEKRCADLGVKPVAVVREAGVSESTWFRWKNLTSSPTFNKIRAVHRALDRIAVERNEHAA